MYGVNILFINVISYLYVYLYIICINILNKVCILNLNLKVNYS